MRLLSLVLVLASLLWFGCRERASPARADAGTILPEGTAEPTAPAVPERLELKVQAEIPDAGTIDVPFEAGVVPEIPPADALVVSTNLALTNYRIRLFDEIDKAMVSDDEPAERADGLGYRIQLPAPLKTGHGYSLVIDAQTGDAILDAQGRAHPEQRLEFRIAGEKEKPPPPPKKRRRR